MAGETFPDAESTSIVLHDTERDGDRVRFSFVHTTPEHPVTKVGVGRNPDGSTTFTVRGPICYSDAEKGHSAVGPEYNDVRWDVDRSFDEPGQLEAAQVLAETVSRLAAINKIGE